MRYRVEGRDGLADRLRTGRLCKLDTEAEDVVERVLGELPTEYGNATATWSLAALRGALARHGWDGFPGTLDRTLHLLGYCYRRPSHDLDRRQDADAVAIAKPTLAVLQEKKLLTLEEYDSSISTSVICTPIHTGRKSGNPGVSRAPSPPPASINGSRSSVPWSTALER